MPRTGILHGDRILAEFKLFRRRSAVARNNGARPNFKPVPPFTRVLPGWQVSRHYLATCGRIFTPARLSAFTMVLAVNRSFGPICAAVSCSSIYR